MLVRLMRSSRLFALSAAVMLVVASGQAQAQPDQLGNKSTVEEPFDKIQTEFNRYLTGAKEATGLDDKEAAEIAATASRWFIYRLTWTTRQGLDRGFFPGVVQSFNRDCMDSAMKKNAANNKVFMQIFNQQMMAKFKEVMALNFASYRIAQINACVMLPALARYGDESFGNYLMDMLKDAKLHDALKVYALKGLRVFFAANPPQPTVDEQSVRASDIPRVEAVLAFLTRETMKEGPPDELEAVRFIRREAIKALAQTRIPAAKITKGEVKVPVALGLMKVLAAEKNGIAPTPSLTEKAEAAIGLCRMNVKDFESYQPEASVYLVGKFLVEFARKYREDAGNLAATATKPPLLAWKYYSERLEQALTDMETNRPKDASPAYQQKLEVLMKNSGPLLEKMKRHGQIDDPSLLENALATIWPAAPALNPYQGFPNLQIQIPALKEAP